MTPDYSCIILNVELEVIILYKKALKYFASHPEVNALSHLTAGIGVGILITYPLIVSHPMRWGLLFLGLGLLGYVYAKIQS